MRKLDHRKLYRLPWSVTDNVISWLEPTKECNIYCDGCYSANAKGSHKSLEQVRSDLDVFERFRQTDAVSIAGGDPLVHPEIVEVVRMIAARGLKPVVNTNGHGLTPSLLRDMKAAGLSGFTFHVDSLQTRPGWKGATEIELNELRQDYADRAAEAGGISCAFNSTVYEKTLPFAPDILEWARRAHRHRARAGLHRLPRRDQERFDYFVGEERVDVHRLVYSEPRRAHRHRRADIVAAMQDRLPDFEPCAYLNGTESPDSFKWLMTLRVGDRKRFVGNAGPKFIELAQVWNHLVTGATWATPAAVHQRPRMLGLAPVDSGCAPRLGAGGHPEPAARGAPAAPPVDHDHPAGRPPPGRPAVDVRQLPGHDRARGSSSGPAGWTSSCSSGS